MAFKPPFLSTQPPLGAKLLGDDTATAAGISVTARSPVTELCRALIEAGHDPDLPLKAYRHDVLCLSVKSIGAGVLLTVRNRTDGVPTFRRLKAPEDSSLALFNSLR